MSDINFWEDMARIDLRENPKLIKKSKEFELLVLKNPNNILSQGQIKEMIQSEREYRRMLRNEIDEAKRTLMDRKED